MLSGAGGADGSDAYTAMAALAPHRGGARSMRYQPGLVGSCRRVLTFCCSWLAGCCAALWQVVSGLCGGCCGAAVRVNGRRLRVVRMLGEGAFAQVHEVRDVSGRRLALKRMILQEVDQRALAQREIQAHQALGSSCPFLMPLVDHEIVVAEGGTREEALLVFPLFAGSLQQVLDERAPTGRVLDEGVALQRFAELCVATQRMHRLDPPLAHRDIKPANIMLTESGAAVLADFGSVGPAHVRVTSRFQALNLQEEAAQFCSMPYRAPELFDIPSNGEIRPNTDVWSLACTLYAMMYGYSPFECEFREDGSARVVECSHLRVLGTVRFPPVRNRASRGFVELLTWMLQVDPKQRPSVDQVLDRLESMGVRCQDRLPSASGGGGGRAAASDAPGASDSAV